MNQILDDDGQRFAVVLTNPPFGCNHRPPDAPGSFSSYGELAFLELSMELLEPGGRCGIIVPDGILFRDARAFRRARERLLSEFTVTGVIRLPLGTFVGAPSVRTNMLFFERRSGQRDAIHYYQLLPAGTQSSSPPLPAGALDAAVAWVRDCKPDRYSWEVRLEDVKRDDWNLDVPWPGAYHDSGFTAGAEQLKLLPDNTAGAGARATPLADWIERRVARAAHETADPLLGISKHGIVPFKGKQPASRSRYQAVQVGDFAYNPMRVADGSVALCQSPHEVGWVSPDYVVFRLRPGAPFNASHVLDFLKSPAGRAEADRHSHGSVQRRLRFGDLQRISVPTAPARRTARSNPPRPRRAVHTA